LEQTPHTNAHSNSTDSENSIPSLAGDQEHILKMLYHTTREYFLLVGKDLRVWLYNRITWDQLRRHAGIEIRPGTHVLELSPPERHPYLLELYESVLQGEVRESELDIPSAATGEIISLHNFFVPARDEQGNIVALLVTAHDVTEQKKTERALIRAEEQWRFAIEGSKLGVWDSDLTSNRIYFSPSYHRLYGFPEGSLQSDANEFYSRVHPDDSPHIAAAMKDHLDGKTATFEYTFRIRDAQERYRWVNARGMIVSRDAAGKPLRVIGTHDDVTATIEAEQRLQQSEQKYRLLFDYNPLPCLIVDAETLQVIRANHEAATFYEIPMEEFAGKCLDSLWRSNLPPDELKRRLDVPRVVPQRFTWPYFHVDGRTIHIEVHSELIQYDNRPARMMVIKDITYQIEAELALRRSHERFQLATRATSDAIYDWDLLTNELYWGESMASLFGHDGSMLSKEKWEELIDPVERDKVAGSLSSLIQDPGRDFWKMEYRFCKANGSWSDVLDRGYVLRDEQGKAFRMIGAMQDITDQKQQERQLLTRQKLISQATIETQERERAEIGKELHDNVNQVLTTTKLYLELSMSNRDLRDELIQKSSKNIIYVINEIRQLSRSLMNPSLGDLGLVDAVNDLVENVNLTRKLEVRVDIDPNIEEMLPDNMQLVVFRIIQEALNNALRHSDAKQICVQLHQGDREIELLVKDDGIGFDPVLVKRGAGLRNIENRVYLANGTLRVESQPQQGCTLIIHIPLKTV
jgi:PAS domain S-box-containing protein